jgi:DNA-binding response OmpR family regulator
MKTKILLVDDDLTLLHLLSQYLRESDFDVVEAIDGQKGLRLAFEEKPDMVLLDVMLPGMDGWEVCARLREMTNIPIIMLTAKTTEADKLRGFQIGVDDYLTKPFSFAELVARMQAILGRAHSQSINNDFISHGEILLDMQRYKASLGNRTLDLTPTEFRLLEVLVKHKGRVVSDGELMQEVWGPYRNDPALIRRFILTLRKKLEIDPSKPIWIRTARGFGYRMGTAPLKSAGSDENPKKNK